MVGRLNRYRFGVNYTPARAWYYCWNDFQEEAIGRDLDAIAEIGADHIRLMLVWPYFQPNPGTVSEVHLERLDSVMALAQERSLDVCVTLFVGWLSGFAFRPPFQEDGSFYDLAASAPAQELYFRAVAERVADRANFLGFDLGNELGCCWRSEDRSLADRWSRHMLALAAELAPHGVHVNGVDHNPWFNPATFSPQHLAADQDLLTLHCWTYFTGASKRSGGDFLSERCLRLPESMAALARSYAGDSTKPVWVQEYGMSEEWLGPESIPGFLERSTLGAIEAGLNWFTWWSSHDLDRAYAFAPLEYSLGLIANDGRIKPQGVVFKQIAEAWRGREVSVSTGAVLPPPPQQHTAESTWEWLDDYTGCLLPGSQKPRS